MNWCGFFWVPEQSSAESLAVQDCLQDHDMVEQEPGHRATSGSVVRSAAPGTVTRGMARCDYSWVPWQTGLVANNSLVGLEPNLLGDGLLSICRQYYTGKPATWTQICFFKAALLITGLHWGFAISYLNLKDPTKKFCSWMATKLLFMWEHKLRTCNSAM